MPITVCNFILDVRAGGKFVVLLPRSDELEGIVAFSDFTRDFQHRHIVERWEKAEGGSLSSRGLRVAGGGWWKLEGDVLILYGQSADFGPFDRPWLRQRFAPGMLAGERAVDIR